MNDEIKEILDYLKDNTEKDMLGYVKDKLLSYEESKLVLDYITNLQEENERLKTNWQVAQEDLTYILKLLDLELGTTIYDIENKILELKGENNV